MKRPIKSNDDMSGVDAGMYTEVILDYYRHPRNKGTLQNPDARFKDWNPLCGDEVEVFLKLNGKKITEIKFNGNGCAISQAAVSMLAEYIQGKPIAELENMSNEEVLGLLGIKVTPIRTKCALLGFNAIKKALHWWEKGIKTEDVTRTDTYLLRK